MKARYLYSELASLVQARRNCASSNNTEWFDKHSERIEKLVKQYLPSGSGFDSGTQIDLNASHANKLVFTTSFHHMDENGMYDGWTEHTLTATPAFIGEFDLRISGRNRNDIKEHIHETFSYALGQDISDDLLYERFLADNPTLTPTKVARPDWQVGKRVKMCKWEDYTLRKLSPWSWLRIENIYGDNLTVRVAPSPEDPSKDTDKLVIPVSDVDLFGEKHVWLVGTKEFEQFNQAHDYVMSLAKTEVK